MPMRYVVLDDATPMCLASYPIKMENCPFCSGYDFDNDHHDMEWCFGFGCEQEVNHNPDYNPNDSDSESVVEKEVSDSEEDSYSDKGSEDYGYSSDGMETECESDWLWRPEDADAALAAHGGADEIYACCDFDYSNRDFPDQDYDVDDDYCDCDRGCNSDSSGSSHDSAYEEYLRDIGAIF